MSASAQPLNRSSEPAARADDIDGQYQIVGPLGSSLTGRSYLARHRELGRLVVVKLMHETVDSRTRGRFEREARGLAQVSHENVARLLGYGRTADGRRYMVVEHVEGRDLRQTLARWGCLPERRALRILDQLARALTAVHAVGLVHRNLKPESVLLGQSRDGKELVKLTNFGLVRAGPDAPDHSDAPNYTRTGPMFGTPRYWSPEQVVGQPADARSDIYAFGVLAYELLTGRTPFQSSTAEGFAWQHVSVPAPRPLDENGSPLVRRELEDLLRRCLAKRPEQRFASMAELRQALARARQPAAPKSKSLVARITTRLREPETWVVTAIAFTAGLLGALIGG